MKKYVIFVLCLLVNADGFCQYNSNNLKKYWFYRKRLIDYFTVTGPGAGESNVAAKRNDKAFWATENFSGRIEFGDQTMNLGDYLAVLATEYKLLNDNKQDISQTAKEIYYALNAINRLDLAGETVFGLPAALNGFFLRTDVDNTFIDSHPDLNKGLPLPPQPYAIGSGFPQAVDVEWGAEAPGWVIPDINTYGCLLFDGDTSNSGGDDWKNRLITSPDQIIGLYTGLALVVKCVPESANYNSMYFFNEARTITDRITMWMKNNNWTIKTPTGCTVYSEPAYMAYAYAIAAGEIMGDRNKYLDWISTPSLSTWCAIDGLLAGGDICSIITNWNPCERTYNWKIVLTLAAIGDSWDNCDNTNLAILTHSSVFDWGSYYSLLFNILHGEIYWFQNSTTESQLSSAPCDGPFNHEPTASGSSDKACCGWACQFRFRGSITEQQIGGGSRGNFPGLDYMLLHNLYYIHRLQANGEDSQGNDLPIYVSYMDEIESLTYPYFKPFHWEGSVSDPHLGSAFRLITANNSIKVYDISNPNYTGNVTYRAGEEISLEDGFEVQEGAEFYAYIDPFSCVGSTYARQSGDTTGRHANTGNNNQTNTSIYGMDWTIPGENNIVPLTYDQNYSNPPNDISTQSHKSDSSKAANNNTIGTVAISSQTNEAPAFFLISPNPSTGMFAILAGKPCDFEATVTDILGRTVFHGAKKSGTYLSINLTAVPQGLYFVKIITGENVFVQKLILQ